MSGMAWSSISIGCTPTRQRKPEEWRAGTCHDAHGKSGARHDQLSVPTRVALLTLKGHPVGTSEVSRPAEGFATGRDFASTGSCSPRPRNYIVSQQINVEVAIHYRRRLRDRGIRSGKAKPWTQCVVFSALLAVPRYEADGAHEAAPSRARDRLI